MPFRLAEEALSATRLWAQIQCHQVFEIVSATLFEHVLDGLRETCRAGGGLARDRLEQGVIEIGLAVYVFVLHADPVESGGLERFAAAQGGEELIGFDVPQVIADQLLAPYLRVALCKPRLPRGRIDAAPTLVQIHLCLFKFPPSGKVPIEHEAYIVPVLVFCCEKKLTGRLLRVM